jgi:hypothetical protein
MIKTIFFFQLSQDSVRKEKNAAVRSKAIEKSGIFIRSPIKVL